MAFGGTAAKLEVLITARDEATKKLMGLTSAMEQSAARMKQIGAGMMGIGTVAVAAMAMGARSLMTYNEELQRLHEVTGLSVEDVQKWRHAINESEGDFNSFLTVFLKLNQARNKAMEGGKSQQKAFAELGISLTKAGGASKSTTELLLDMSDVVGKGKKSEDDLANAMELIGIRGGKAFIPVLKQGRLALEGFFAAAEKMGLITTAESETIDKLTHKIEALSIPLMKLRAQFLVAVNPVLERMTELLDSAMIAFNNLSPSTQKFLSYLALLGPALLVVAGAGLVFKGFLTGLAVFKWALIASGMETVALKAMYMAAGLKAFSLAAVKAIGWAAAIYAIIEAEVRVINAGTSGIFKLMQAYEKLRGRGNGPAAQDYGEQSKKYWDMAISPKSQAWESIFKPMVETFVDAISSMAEAAKLPGENLQKSLQTAGDEAEKQFGGGAGLNKSAFGIGDYMPALMGVSGNLSGTVRPGVNVLNFTIFADDRRVGEAVQSALNKSIH